MSKVRKRKKTLNSDTETLTKTASYKEIDCSQGCGRKVRIDSSAEAAICWHCVATSVVPPEIHSAPKNSGNSKKPKGWHFMKIFVDSEGNVFHEGVEQPTLKGTLPSTPIKPKKTIAQKKAEVEKKEKKLAKLYEKKQQLKKRQDEKKQNNLDSSV